MIFDLGTIKKKMFMMQIEMSTSIRRSWIEHVCFMLWSHTHTSNTILIWLIHWQHVERRTWNVDMDGGHAVELSSVAYVPD